MWDGLGNTIKTIFLLSSIGQNYHIGIICLYNQSTSLKLRI